jgi:hypothetical protein
MLKTFAATLALISLAAAVLMFSSPREVEADGWTSRTPMVGTYFAAAGTTVSVSDSLKMFFSADSSAIQFADPGATTSVTYLFFSMRNFDATDTIYVYTRSTPQGILKVTGLDDANNFDMTLPSFARGIDSVVVYTDATGILAVTVLGGK